jgi:branched-chain amino acid transport system permease protein
VSAYYWFTVAVAGTALVLLWRLGRSPLGAIFAALRDNPSRANAIGVSLYRYRLAAFVISGAFCGLAGALHAYFSRGMFADSAHFTNSSAALVAILLGGAQSFFGPILGGTVFVLFRTTVGALTPYWPMLLGFLICAVAVTRPDGVLVMRKAKGKA